MIPIVRVEGLKKYFPVEKGLLASIVSTKRRFVHAVDGVSFDIAKGETFSLVGETGSGKTTVGRLILRAIEPTEGKIFFEGQDILNIDRNEMRRLRRDMQIIFQNPYASLNPRMTVSDIIGEPLEVHGIARDKTERISIVKELLERVGLSPSEQYLNRYPHEFSGGQRQRIGIARALALKPKFIVADEPVSALDMSVRSEILNLLQDLKQEFKLSYLLIAHDLSVVRYMSDWVAVMYLGKIMESACCEELFNSPSHPYTEALISAVPIPNPEVKREKIRLRGEMPSPINPPTGCVFHTRCPFAKPECIENQPNSVEIRTDHYVACHLHA